MFVKIKYAEKDLAIRLKYESQTLADLAEKIREKCQIDEAQQLFFTYLDAEGDKITLDTTDDLQNAIEDVKIHQKDKNPITLTLDVYTAPRTTLTSTISVVQDALIGKRAEVSVDDHLGKEFVDPINFSESFINPTFEAPAAPQHPTDETTDHLEQFRRLADQSTLTSIQPVLENPDVINVFNTGNFPMGSISQPSNAQSPEIQNGSMPCILESGTSEPRIRPAVLHNGISCSDCGVASIQGFRHMSLTNHGRNLCSECVKLAVHSNEPFIVLYEESPFPMQVELGYVQLPQIRPRDHDLSPLGQTECFVNQPKHHLFDNINSRFQDADPARLNHFLWKNCETPVDTLCSEFAKLKGAQPVILSE